jgi:outer membrane protein insertion porin family
VIQAKLMMRTLPLGLVLLSCTALVSPAMAQQAPAPQQVRPAIAPPIGAGTVRSVQVAGNERIEADTVRTYVQLNPGDRYDATLVDEALKRLYATELFSDVTIRVNNDVLTVTVRENPVINRIVFEGNRRVKEDKLTEEVRLAPRQIYTRSKVRADVNRMIEVYRRSGRFAATIEPKVIQLEQNRVDLVFEINEGPKSKVRQINFIGNERFSSGDLREEIFTRQARWWRLFTSNDTYDPDRLSADREKLRQYYLTQGYADFRVSSAVAELTPDREDFIITMTIEEGERYKFGKIDLESKIRDLKAEDYKRIIPIEETSWYNAKQVEDTIELLQNTAGLFGYAFADIRPRIKRDREKRTMDVTFVINEAPRVYVERIDINGNTRTLDQVIRREFRLAEGDAFNSFKVKRSKERIQSLGFFQEKLEIEQKPGSTPDKVVLEVNVEEKSTGQLTLGAGFSSLESFIFNLGVAQRNFLGRGQDVRLNVELSSFRNQVDLSFTEPYFLGRNLAAGIDVFRRDASDASFGQFGDDFNLDYSQLDTGFQLRLGFPVTEYWSYGLNYGLSQTSVRSAVGGQASGYRFFPAGSTGVDLSKALPGPAPGAVQRCVEITLDAQGNAIGVPSASPFICDAYGKRTTSALGHSLVYDSLNNRARPSAGQRFVFSQQLAGLGGSVKYLRTTASYDHFFPMDLGPLGDRWVLRLGADGGHILGFGSREVRFTDRFFLGTPRFRGFAFRGIGPRDCNAFDPNDSANPTAPNPVFACEDIDRGQKGLNLGGNLYYQGTAELEVPLGAAASELGLRASAFVDVGALWSAKFDSDIEFDQRRVFGDTPSPRVAVGIGVSWNSPFGPFRIDLTRALKKNPADETESFQFNVGTQF